MPDRPDLNDVIDLHVHAGPDVRPRKMDAWDLVARAEAQGMHTIVLKNHFTPTTLQAAAIAAKTKRLKVLGGVALNYPTGGLNPAAVKTELALGAKIVWMPTHDAEHERAYRGKPGTGIRIMADGNVHPEVVEIVQRVAETDAILATGHLSFEEIITLLKTCRENGLKRTLVNHPGIIFQRFTHEQQREMIGLGATLEHSFSRPPHTLSADDLAEAIRQLDPAHLVIATDLGQPENPDPVTGMQNMLDQLFERGISVHALKQMTCRNPFSLLYG